VDRGAQDLVPRRLSQRQAGAAEDHPDNPADREMPTGDTSRSSVSSPWLIRMPREGELNTTSAQTTRATCCQLNSRRAAAPWLGQQVRSRDQVPSRPIRLAGERQTCLREERRSRIEQHRIPVSRQTSDLGDLRCEHRGPPFDIPTDRSTILALDSYVKAFSVLTGLRVSERTIAHSAVPRAT
jgi:hypothetical protein